MLTHADSFAAVVTAHPDDEDHAPLLQDPVLARVARAGDIADGDLILAALSPHQADYFNEPYTAHPEPYNPHCPCGVCCELTDQPGPVTVLSNGHPWQSCDPWPADDLILIIPAQPLPSPAAKE
ncbi:hypothetical protein [Streptomyces melanogenes]|uniref:hypothetical protein n=1 Tax=Streptomyces melanogenes TaxID=67326 RepID=UPI00167DC868|nr:hypothetical protein [Streptomyces melanogenes]GGP80807.1 hypothetical protein GCM10010278_69170 [Streptomyces melanogenes]